MSTVDYINMFAEALKKLIETLMDFFNRLTGKVEEADTAEKPE